MGMDIGNIIRKYRKEKNLTQEEVAKYLGVTAPAVNKWENGNAMPDITLLAPIARLLDVSLNELLSFREELTEQEIRELTDKLKQRLETEDFEDVYLWAKKQTEEFPDCESLIYNFSVVLDAFRLSQNIPNPSRYDSFILTCYERLSKSNNEAMRFAGADALFGFYYRAEQYEKAQKLLSCFSDQNPDKKRKQAALYEKTGETDKAYQTYEEILFSGYQMLSLVFNNLFAMEKTNGNMQKSKYYAEKRKDLVRLFEMGDYNISAVDLELLQLEKDIDKTISCIRGLLENVDTLYAFLDSPLFSHMTFRKPEPDLAEKLKKSILEGLNTDDSLSYIKDDPRWNEIMGDKI